MFLDNKHHFLSGLTKEVFVLVLCKTVSNIPIYVANIYWISNQEVNSKSTLKYKLSNWKPHVCQYIFVQQINHVGGNTFFAKTCKIFFY